MKHSLLSLLLAASLSVGLSACAPRPAAQFAPTLEAPKADIVVQADAAPKPAAASTSNMDTAEEGKVTGADALKLIMLQWLVAR